MFRLFSDYILLKHVFPKPLLSRKFLIKYPSSMVNPIVAEQPHMKPEQCNRYQINF